MYSLRPKISVTDLLNLYSICLEILVERMNISRRIFVLDISIFIYFSDKYFPDRESTWYEPNLQWLFIQAEEAEQCFGSTGNIYANTGNHYHSHLKYVEMPPSLLLNCSVIDCSLSLGVIDNIVHQKKKILVDQIYF